MDNPIGVAKDIAKARRNYGVSKESNRKVIQRYRNMTMEELSEKGYDEFAALLTANMKSKHEFIQRLKVKGYNAVIDDNDVKTGWLQSQAPLLVFDAYKSLEQVSIKELTRSDIIKNIEDWTNMKHSYIFN